jgi:uncharacterized protein (DUF2147 family)
MKTLSAAAAIAALLTAALFVTTGANAASPAAGLWLAPSHNAQIEITDCGEAICGRLVSSDGLRANPDSPDTNNKDPNLRSRPLKDLLMLEGFTGGPTEWKGGTVYNPDDGGIYKGTITLISPDNLKLTGCIVFPLCKTQVWKRAK